LHRTRRAGIAIDATTAEMYWVDLASPSGNGGEVQRATLDGDEVTTLVTGVASPASIALDPRAGKMYWTANSNFSADTGGWTGSVQRANLDGTDVEDVVTGVPNLWGVAANTGDGKIYWTSESLGIQRADRDGTNVETLLTLEGGADGIVSDVRAGQLYFTHLFGGPIERVRLDGSARTALVPEPGESQYIALGPDS
jgi:hypothetical protein